MPTTRTTHTTVVARSSLLADVDALLRASAGRACKQERTAQRLVELSHGLAFNLGRQTLSRGRPVADQTGAPAARLRARGEGHRAGPARAPAHT